MQLTISWHIIIPNGTIKGSGIGSLFQSKVSRKRQDLSAGANGSVECLTTIIETRRDGIENERIDYLDLTRNVESSGASQSANAKGGSAWTIKSKRLNRS